MRIRGINDSIFLITKDFVHVRVRFKDIIAVTGCSNYSKVQTTKREFIISKTMKEVLSEIPHGILLRISKSSAINIDFVESIRGNEIQVKGSWFMVSKSMRKELFV